MHFDQCGHPERFDPLTQADQRVLFERSDNQQHQICAVRAGFVHLIRAHHEVLAQDRNRNRRAYLVQIGQRTAEAALLGQDADHPSTAELIFGGETGGGGYLGQIAFGRAAPLYLGDHGNTGRTKGREGVQRGWRR